MKKIFFLFIVLLFCFSSYSQNVTFSLTTDSIVFEGQTYVTFWSSALISNNNSDTVIIEAIRQENVVPDFPVWRSAMCADICYAFSTDTIQFTIPPLASQVFEMRFEYTNHNPDTAHTKIFFHSVTPTITFNHTQNYYAMDSLLLASVSSPETQEMSIKIFPNPAVSQLTVDIGALSINSVEVYDMLGQKCLALNSHEGLSASINVSALSPGINFLKVNNVLLRFIKQ